jgi:hypothetical protein
VQGNADLIGTSRDGCRKLARPILRPPAAFQIVGITGRRGKELLRLDIERADPSLIE